MQLDNSAANAFRKCPLLYFETYVQRLQRVTVEPSAMDYGTRVHTLLAEKNHILKGESDVQLSPEYPHPGLEAEAQAMVAAYNSFYPVDPFDIVDVERTFQVNLPCPLCKSCADCNCNVADVPGVHTYCGKFDAIVRLHSSGKLAILEHKTESRNSKMNTPEAWASRTQAQLYIWAAQQVYNEPIKGVILNILTRQSPKGQVGCSFRRDDNLLYDQSKLDEAIADIVWVADQIETCERLGFWPAFREACVSPTGWACDFRDPHLIGWTEELKLVKFKEAEQYLSL